MKTNEIKTGPIALVGFLIMMIGATIWGGVNYFHLIGNMITFIFGGLESVPDGSTETLGSIVTTCIALMLVCIAVAVAMGYLSMHLHGMPKSYDHEALEKMLDKGPLAFFSVMFFEEAMARIIPLGLLTYIFTGNVAFYVLLIVGNVAWAAIHLVNYKDGKERNWSIILPQIVAGLMLAYVYVRYGFFASLMVHYLYDVVLLSMKKEQHTHPINWFITFYYAMIMLGSRIIMIGRGIDDTVFAPWWNSTGALEKLPGLTFWDYALLMVFIMSLIQTISGLLRLDSSNAHAISVGAYSQAIITALTTLVIAGLSMITMYFFDNVLVSTIAVSIIVSLTMTSTSGSMLARVWFTTMPYVFLLTAVYIVLGFWALFGIVLILEILSIVPRLLNLHLQRITTPAAPVSAV